MKNVDNKTSGTPRSRLHKEAQQREPGVGVVVVRLARRARAPFLCVKALSTKRKMPLYLEVVSAAWSSAVNPHPNHNPQSTLEVRRLQRARRDARARNQRDAMYRARLTRYTDVQGSRL